jgi:hypothetical protein
MASPLPPQSFPLYFFSSGKNYNDYSLMDQCRSIPNAQACAAIVPIPDNWLVAGVCLPASCTDAQMSESVSVQSLLYLNFPEAALWKLPVITQCGLHLGGGPWKGSAIAVLALCGVVGCVVLFATAMVWATQPAAATLKDRARSRDRGAGDVEIGTMKASKGDGDVGLTAPLLSPTEVRASPCDGTRMSLLCVSVASLCVRICVWGLTLRGVDVCACVCVCVRVCACMCVRVCVRMRMRVRVAQNGDGSHANGTSKGCEAADDDYDGDVWQRATTLLCPRRGSMAYKLLACFDLIHNYRRMVSINAERGGETAALNGVRALSLGFVILGHTLYWMSFTGFVNPTDVFPPNGAFSTWAMQVCDQRAVSPSSPPPYPPPSPFSSSPSSLLPSLFLFTVSQSPLSSRPFVGPLVGTMSSLLVCRA